MFAELADVVLRAMDEARLASAHEVEAQHIEARCVDDSSRVQPWASILGATEQTPDGGHAGKNQSPDLGPPPPYRRRHRR